MHHDLCSAEVANRFEAYVSKLCQEITLHAHLNAQPLQTIFFGGGTPSLIPPHLLERILSTIVDHFGIAHNAEISMEADPGTFDVGRLRDYMNLGVTRFSVGVQAFDEVQ
jgi:coproporphyrinogen III oxidase-like Fe-S oxidoreductase